MNEDEKFAKCRVCQGRLKHAPVVIDTSEGDEKHAYILPSYHAECVPKERQSGGKR